MSDNAYHELFPLGTDDAPYRKLTGEHVTTGRFEGRRNCQDRARGADPARGRGVCRFGASAAAGSSGVAARGSRRPRGLAERPVRRLRPLKKRQHRRRQGLADVPGHRHRDRDGQKGPAGVDRGRRRGGDLGRHPPHLYRDQSALQPGGAVVDVRGGQHRRQSAGADRPLCRARRPIQIPVHRQGRRLGQQELSLSAVKGGAQSEGAAQISRRQDPHPRHRRLPALSPRDRHRRHLGRDEFENRQARQLPLSRHSAGGGQPLGPGLSRPRL